MINSNTSMPTSSSSSSTETVDTPDCCINSTSAADMSPQEDTATVASEANSNEKTETPVGIVRRIITLAAPILLGTVLSYSAQTITNSFVGRRLGAEQFAHYTLGMGVADLFGYSIGIGLNGALDTFVSQAFGRDGQATKDIGASVQRAIFISLITAIPLAFIFIYGGPIFRLVYGEELGNGAWLFTRYAFPNLVFCFLKDTLTKTLQAINLPKLVLYSAMVSATCCLALNYFFTTSIPSAVTVLTISDGIQLLMLLSFTRFHPDVTFWHHCAWPCREALSLPGFSIFLKVGIPALLAVCAQWWAIEMLDIVAANVSVEAVAFFNLATMSIGVFYFAQACAVSVATCVLVGNALGDNKPLLARQYAKYGFILDQCLNTFNATFLIIFRRPIVHIFTSDEELANTFCSMILVVVCLIWCDSTQFCLQHILKGAAQQKVGAKTAVLSLWAIGIPAALVFGRWAGLGGPGILMGLVCGFLFAIPMLIYRITHWDWEALALNASKSLDNSIEEEKAEMEENELCVDKKCGGSDSDEMIIIIHADDFIDVGAKDGDISLA